MSAHPQLLQQANLLTGRQMVLAVTIALHALVIGALMTVPYVPAMIKDVIVEPAWIEPFTPPPEKVEPVPTEIPMKLDLMPVPVTEIPIVVPIIDLPDNNALPTQPMTADVEAEATAISTADVTGTGTTEAPSIAQTALQYRVVRPADDYYPAASLRLEEAGMAIVQVCVAPSGRLEGAPTIQQSSGSPRLDAAALTWAREALRFTPATRGGAPISACKGFRVNFKLH